jgi:hypothetical protein
MSTATPKQPDPLTFEYLTEAGRKAGNAYLDGYEKAVNGLADLHVKTAQATKLEYVTTVAETQAAVTRQLTAATVTAARELLD